MTHIPSSYCQGSTLPGITYIGMTLTMEHDQLYPNVICQPFYNLHHDHDDRNTSTYYWSHDKQQSSRSFTIRPILTKKELLKQILIL